MPQPSSIDFIAPFDPTGYTSITGAQLLQLVSGLYPNTDTGLTLITADIAGIPQVPDASTTTKWENYIWIRQSATYVTAYVWNPNGATDATYLNWVTIASASIGAGTIQGYMIAPNTIPASAIISISATQISGSVVPAWLAQLNISGTAYSTNGLMNNNSPVFGVLNGAGSTVGIPVFGTQVIPSTAYGLQTIGGSTVALASPIVDNSITTRQLLSNGGTATAAATIAAVDPKTNIIVPTTSIPGIPSNTSVPQASAIGDILGIGYNANAAQLGFVTISRALLNLDDPASVAGQVQIPIVKAAATAYSYANFGNLTLQKINAQYSTATDCTGSVSMTDSVVGMTTKGTSRSSGVAVTITPLAGTSGSKVIVTAHVPVYLNISGGGALWLGLYDSVSALFIAFARFGGTNISNVITLKGTTAALTVNTARTFTIYIGTTSGTAANAQTNYYSEGAFITAEEVL